MLNLEFPCDGWRLSLVGGVHHVAALVAGLFDVRIPVVVDHCLGHVAADRCVMGLPGRSVYGQFRRDLEMVGGGRVCSIGVDFRGGFLRDQDDHAGLSGFEPDDFVAGLDRVAGVEVPVRIDIRYACLHGMALSAVLLFDEQDGIPCTAGVRDHHCECRLYGEGGVRYLCSGGYAALHDESGIVGSRTFELPVAYRYLPYGHEEGDDRGDCGADVQKAFQLDDDTVFVVLSGARARLSLCRAFP